MRRPKFYSHVFTMRIGAAMRAIEVVVKLAKVSCKYEISNRCWGSVVSVKRNDMMHTPKIVFTNRKVALRYCISPTV